MTNLDKIKQMNAEEMVDFMCLIALSDLCDTHCAYERNTTDCYNGHHFCCGDGVKAWLESEVEE